MKKLIILIAIFAIFASPLVAASNPQTTTPLAPKPDSKVPKNFEVYDQRVKEYNAKGQLVKETILYNNTEAVGETHTYEYLDKGLTVVKKNIKADGTYYRYTVKRYDAAGNHLETSEYRIK